jgi:AraC family transcriptional regulator
MELRSRRQSPPPPQRSPPVFGKETRRELAEFSLVESVYPPSSVMSRHTHELAHISVVLGGAYAERYGQRDRLAEPSDVIIHPPGEDHSVRFRSAGARVFSIHLKPTWLERVRHYSKILDSPADFSGGYPATLALRLYREFRETDEVAPLMIESLALEIIAAAARRASPPEEHRPRWLEQARELLHSTFAEQVTLAGVASEVGVHPVYLAARFRRHYHCTVGEYVRRLRLEAACRDVSASDAPLSEIASATGFYDQSHFTNLFKRHTGMTPAQYRAAFRPN